MYRLALCLPRVGQPQGLPVPHKIPKELIGSFGIRGVRLDVGAGLVPAPPRATTRVAPTDGVNPLKSQRPNLFSSSQPK